MGSGAGQRGRAASSSSCTRACAHCNGDGCGHGRAPAAALTRVQSDLRPVARLAPPQHRVAGNPVGAAHKHLRACAAAGSPSGSAHMPQRTLQCRAVSLCQEGGPPPPLEEVTVPRSRSVLALGNGAGKAAQQAPPGLRPHPLSVRVEGAPTQRRVDPRCQMAHAKALPQHVAGPAPDHLCRGEEAGGLPGTAGGAGRWYTTLVHAASRPLRPPLAHAIPDFQVGTAAAPPP